MPLRALSINTPIRSINSALSTPSNKEEKFKKKLDFCIKLLQMIESHHSFNTCLRLPLFNPEQRKALLSNPTQALSYLTKNWRNPSHPDTHSDLMQKVSKILFKHNYTDYLDALQENKLFNQNIF